MVELEPEVRGDSPLPERCRSLGNAPGVSSIEDSAYKAQEDQQAQRKINPGVTPPPETDRHSQSRAQDEQGRDGKYHIQKLAGAAPRPHLLDGMRTASAHHNRQFNGERHKEAQDAENVDKEDEMIPIHSVQLLSSITSLSPESYVWMKPCSTLPGGSGPWPCWPTSFWRKNVTACKRSGNAMSPLERLGVTSSAASADMYSIGFMSSSNPASNPTPCMHFSRLEGVDQKVQT